MALCRSLFSIVTRNMSKNIRPHHSFNLNIRRSISTHNSILYNSESPSSEDVKTEELTAEQKEIQDLKEKMNDFKDKYQRTLADRENVRKRLQKEVQDAQLFAVQGFCKDIIEVTDIFQKALENVDEKDLQHKESTPLKALHRGLSLTETQLLKVLRRHGLERLKVKEGDVFDPEVQQVMFEVPLSEGSTPGTVATILREGWALHNRVIRSVQVGVFSE